MDGNSDMEVGYGIALAAHCGFPEAVLQEAERVKRLLERKGRDAGGRVEEEAVPEGASPPWCYAVLQRLMMLKGCLDPDSRCALRRCSSVVLIGCCSHGIQFPSCRTSPTTH